MITSNRKFGVEIEFVTNSQKNFDSLRNKMNVIEDGSLRPLKYAGEYVSPVLNGASGESHIHTVCETLKKYGAESSHPATSLHVHLDGRAHSDTVSRSRTIPKSIRQGTYIHAVSNKLLRISSMAEITKSVLSGRTIGSNAFSQNVYVGNFDGIIFYSLAELTRKPCVNYTYLYASSNDRFKWLQNVLYFYTAFSQVMEDMVSKSRRFGNMYCIPLGISYDLEQIEKAKTMEELRTVWYKDSPSSGHYNDSRYHNVNLHSFWDRHGTVEIRSHGGTTDPHKIVLWVKLHQKIVDKLEDIELSELKKLVVNDELHRSFLEFIDEPMLQEYVKRLVGYYSNKKI